MPVLRLEKREERVSGIFGNNVVGLTEVAAPPRVGSSAFSGAAHKEVVIFTLSSTACSAQAGPLKNLLLIILN